MADGNGVWTKSKGGNRAFISASTLLKAKLSKDEARDPANFEKIKRVAINPAVKRGDVVKLIDPGASGKKYQVVSITSDGKAKSLRPMHLTSEQRERIKATGKKNLYDRQGIGGSGTDKFSYTYPGIGKSQARNIGKAAAARRSEDK